MSTTQVRGITGLLDGILSPATRPAPDLPKRDHRTDHALDETPTAAFAMPLRTAVRRGRPPGKPRVSPPKEKVTVWIERGLIDSYRDWTWQARCQLSHIVERALTAYHAQHHRPPANKSHGRGVLP